MDTFDKNELSRLITESLDGVITSERLNRLDQLLSQQPEAVEYYIHHLRLYSFLSDREGIIFENSKADKLEVLSKEMWKNLADYEKNAPSIEIEEKEPQPELVQKVVYEKKLHRISKFTIFSGVISTAALIFMVLFVKFVPQQYSVEVATLVDQLGVKWSDSTFNIDNEDRLWTNQAPIGLDKGVIEIQYDDGVNVIIEGPAKFTVKQSEIYLDYGRLFSRVSESGLGFMVVTPTIRFIDQGTEFGVQADVNGSAELHVIKGKVQLFADLNDGSKTSQLVTENQAACYVADRRIVQSIAVKKETFARTIDSTRNSVWRGQQHLSLPDMVAGGDGFGTGDYRKKIDYFNGKIIQEDKFLYTTRNDRKYVVVDKNPYIDGVFIPDGGETGQVIVSSQGDIYHSCPDTGGAGSRIIINHVKRATEPGDEAGVEYIVNLDGQTYGTIENPSLFMHANNAMTFNLDNIRRKHPNLTIRSFSALFGLSDAILLTKSKEPQKISAEFIVLVDGQERFRRLAYPVDTAATVHVEIEQDARFLTLMVTNGDRGFSHNWCIWARPFLDIESAAF